MPSFTDLILASAVLSVAHGHGVILGAQGIAGSPASVGFQVNAALARNCTTINPCQQDATIIRDAEILANLVNECGRTELSGNIDVGENTENALAAGAVTQVKKGSELTVTIHQVNADGAGPYACDLDLTSNSNGVSGQTPLVVTNNVPGVNGFSQAKTQAFNITVKLPDDMACTGASTGNVCTVRCRNNAVAGPFGGCFAVQQTDTTAKANTPQNIATKQSFEVSESQVLLNQQDLPAAIAANQAAGLDSAKKNVEAVNSILDIKVVSKASPVQTPAAVVANPAAGTAAGTTAAVATASAAPAAGNGRGNRNGNNNNAGATRGGNNNNAATGNGRGNNNNNAANNAAADNAAAGNRNANNNKRDTSGLRWAKRME